MSTQLIDLESGSVATGDSGERADADAIKPIDAGERVQAAVIDRPFENLRARTEELRQKVEELLYRADADKWIITGGNTIGQVTVPGAVAFPTVSWNATTGLCTVSEAIVVQPFVAPSTDLFGFIDWAFTESVAPFGTVTFRFEANDDPLAGTILFDYQLANSLRVYWESSASLGAGVYCTATLEGSPVHMLRIVVRDDGQTTAGHVSDALNLILAPAVPDSILKFALTGLTTTFVVWVETPGRPNEYMFNTYSREMHRMTKAVFDGFFIGSPLSVDGDGIGIWYEELTDSDTTQHGGRRQATPTTATDVGPFLPPNTVVPVTKLFKFSTEPEKIPGCIPLCRRIGTYLVFIDGTVVAHNQTIALGYADSTLLARYNAHIAGTAEQHAAGAITSTPYSWIAAANVGAAINEIVDDLASTTSGTTRIGGAAIVDAPSGVVLGTLYAQLTEILGHINDRVAIAALSDNAGADSGDTLVGCDAVSGTPTSLVQGTVKTQTSALLTAINARTRRTSSEYVRARWFLDELEGGSFNYGTTGTTHVASFSWAPEGGSIGVPSNDILLSGTGTRNVLSTGLFIPKDIACTAWVDSDGITLKQRVCAIIGSGVLGGTTCGSAAIYNSTTGGIIDTDPLDGLPALGGTTWTAVACCAYDKYLYVLASGTGGAGFRLQRYNIETGSPVAEWSPATVVSYACACPTVSVGSDHRIIVASGQRIAVLLGGEGLNTGAIAFYNIVTGAAAGVGRGTGINAATALPTGGMVSDGTYVWYTYIDAADTTKQYLACVRILSPTSTTGTRFMLIDDSAPVNAIAALGFDGSRIWVHVEGIGSGVSAMRAFSIDLITGSAPTVVLDQDADISVDWSSISFSDFVFDGINMHALASKGGHISLISWDVAQNAEELTVSAKHRALVRGSETLGAILTLYDTGRLGFDLNTVWASGGNPTMGPYPVYAYSIRGLRAASRR
jgi:hypothetical protein